LLGEYRKRWPSWEVWCS